MKKKLFFAVAFVLVAWSFTACESNCKFCALNLYENGNLVDPGDETEYCGADLIAQEAIPDAPVGQYIGKVECR